MVDVGNQQYRRTSNQAGEGGNGTHAGHASATPWMIARLSTGVAKAVDERMHPRTRLRLNSGGIQMLWRVEIAIQHVRRAGTQHSHCSSRGINATEARAVIA